MKEEELKAEIEKLEVEAKQMLANANFIVGAVHAYKSVLARLEQKPKVADDDSTRT